MNTYICVLTEKQMDLLIGALETAVGEGYNHEAEKLQHFFEMVKEGGSAVKIEDIPNSKSKTKTSANDLAMWDYMIRHPQERGKDVDKPNL